MFMNLKRIMIVIVLVLLTAGSKPVSSTGSGDKPPQSEPAYLETGEGVDLNQLHFEWRVILMSIIGFVLMMLRLTAKRINQTVLMVPA